MRLPALAIWAHMDTGTHGCLITVREPQLIRYGTLILTLTRLVLCFVCMYSH